MDRQPTLLNPAESWWAAQATLDRESAVKLLQTEALGGRHQHSVYELFAEMEEKDGHLYSVLQTRLNGLLGLPRRLVPGAPDSEQARSAAQFAGEALEAIPEFQGLLRALLDGVSKGFAAVELVWDYDARGRLTVVDWKTHPQEWFAFSQDGTLQLLSPPFRAPGSEAIDNPAGTAPAGRSTIAGAQAFSAPARKFLLLRFGADQRNPYGRGLCQRAYWYYWFKRNTLKFWAIFNEKYGAPTAVARYGPGTTDDDRRQLREILEALQTDTGVVLPESVQLELIEAGRSSGGESFRDFLDWCNDEMSKIVLGATLTSSEGRRSGSLALGTIHELVRRDYIEADAHLLEDVLNGSLVRWLHEANFPAETPAPRYRIEAEPPEDLSQRMALDRDLLAAGIALPAAYFYERYGRPAPQEGQNVLRFDDANFFKYHLQYGILTVNEVRRRLGLSEVPWGGERTRAQTDETIDEDSPEDAGRQPR